MKISLTPVFLFLLILSAGAQAKIANSPSSSILRTNIKKCVPGNEKAKVKDLPCILGIKDLEDTSFPEHETYSLGKTSLWGACSFFMTIEHDSKDVQNLNVGKEFREEGQSANSADGLQCYGRSCADGNSEIRFKGNRIVLQDREAELELLSEDKLKLHYQVGTLVGAFTGNWTTKNSSCTIDLEHERNN